MVPPACLFLLSCLKFFFSLSRNRVKCIVCPENKELSWLCLERLRLLKRHFIWVLFLLFLFFLWKTKKPQYKVRLVVTGSLSWGADYTGRSWSSSLYIFTDALLVSCMLWVNAVGLCCDVNTSSFYSRSLQMTWTAVRFCACKDFVQNIFSHW